MRESIGEGGLCICVAGRQTAREVPGCSCHLQPLAHVAIGLDADDAGDDGAKRLSAELSGLGAKCDRWRPQGGKDWNDLLQHRGLQFLCAEVKRLRHAGP
jgi:hypothetical protein